MQKLKLHTFTLIVLLFMSRILSASERVSSYPSTIFRGQQHNFAGLKNKSFADVVAYSAGVTVLMQREYFVPYIGFNVGKHSAKQSFLDGTIEVKSNYTYQYGSGEAGLYIFPVGRQIKGLNLYVNAGGLAGYQSISLQPSTSLRSISVADQNFSTGYKANVGFEWILKNKSKDAKWTVYAEVGFKKESAKLLKQTFTLDSLNYSVGLGW
jgi:hypothetical protein